MSCSLNSFEWFYKGDYIGSLLGVVEADTRSLEVGSYGD